jgi:hypothetical protein
MHKGELLVVAGYYLVKQGDHLSGIAHAFGYSDYDTIWNDPNNAALKQLRKNPHVLFPGDSIFIPDKESQTYPRPTEKRHDFVLKAKPLQIKIRMERAYLKAISSTQCDLTVGTDKGDLVSDGDGAVQRAIAKDAEQATATIHEPIPGTPATGAGSSATRDTVVPVRVGYLDPVEEKSGQLQRLSNLGYFRGSFDSPDPADVDSAVQEFQCDEGLQVDGVCGPATQAKLKLIHGC